MTNKVRIGRHSLGQGRKLFLIAGPCVIESEQHALMMARRLSAVARRLRIPYIFKASFDKANRTSAASYRGPGLERGLEILGRIRKEVGIPILTDIHEAAQADAAAKVCDVLQIPAFLSRQTDLLEAVGRSGAAVNIKKGQFISPWEMRNAVDKIEATGNRRIVITERGTTFGYNNLVVDMRAIAVMREWGYPVVLDCTHSLQLPGGQGKQSGGQPQFIETLARAGVAAGVDGIFMEVHDHPEKALSDAATSLNLRSFMPLARRLRDLAGFVRRLR